MKEFLHFLIVYVSCKYREYKFLKSLSPVNRQLYLNLNKLERIAQKNRKVLKKLGLLN